MSLPFDPEILFEDNHLIAVNKPAGILVQGDITGDLPLVEIIREWIKKKYNKPGNVFTGVIHRLDRPVSGVVLFAKTSKALSRFNQLFRTREVIKTYWAISDKVPAKAEGELTHFLEKDRSKNKVKVVAKGKDSQKSVLKYKVLGHLEGLNLIEVKPETGRPHQIRVQLSENHSPIAGDLKYASEYSTGDNSILLHARQLEFVHPVKKENIKITARPPDRKEWNIFSGLKE